jgi:hypothetical protein
VCPYEGYKQVHSILELLSYDSFCYREILWEPATDHSG